MKVLAHRGAMALAPQNTMPAFRLAWESGADGIELDVQCTKDGIPVVFHDDRLDDLTDGAGPVRGYTLEQLQKLDAGSHFGSEWKGERIPTLEEVLRERPKGSIVNIEIKTEMEFDPFFDKILHFWRFYPPLARDRESPREKEALRTAKTTADCLRGLLPEFPDLRENIIVSSFDPAALEFFRAEMPEIAQGFLYCVEVRRDTRPLMKEIAHEAVHPSVFEISARKTREIHAAGKKVNCWTVNKDAQVRKLYRMGVDTIITNHPHRMVKHIKELDENNKKRAGKADTFNR